MLNIPFNSPNPFSLLHCALSSGADLHQLSLTLPPLLGSGWLQPTADTSRKRRGVGKHQQSVYYSNALASGGWLGSCTPGSYTEGPSRFPATPSFSYRPLRVLLTTSSPGPFKLTVLMVLHISILEMLHHPFCFPFISSMCLKFFCLLCSLQ